MTRLHFLGISACLLLSVGCSAKATQPNQNQPSTTAFTTVANTTTVPISNDSAALIKEQQPLKKDVANSVSNSTSKNSAKSQVACPNARTQTEINECLGQDAKEADKKLNQTYQQLIKRYETGSPERQKLLDAQLAWIKYRDATCAFSYSRFVGGSIAPSVYSNCIKRVTEQRITDFQNYMTEGMMY